VAIGVEVAVSGTLLDSVLADEILTEGEDTIVDETDEASRGTEDESGNTGAATLTIPRIVSSYRGTPGLLFSQHSP
jgi:hypothetical protein